MKCGRLGDGEGGSEGGDGGRECNERFKCFGEVVEKESQLVMMMRIEEEGREVIHILVLSADCADGWIDTVQYRDGLLTFQSYHSLRWGKYSPHSSTHGHLTRPGRRNLPD